MRHPLRRPVLAVLLTVALVLMGAGVFAATTQTTASCTANPAITQSGGSSKFSVTCTVPNPPASTVTKTATATATVTKTVTASPSPSSTPTSTPTPTPTPTPSPTATSSSGTWSCVVTIKQNSGCPDVVAPDGSEAYYDPADFPMANGWDTFVNDQDVGWNGVGNETLSANGAVGWQVVSNIGSCGGCVQTFPDVQQLTNDWGPDSSGKPGWNGGADTPVDSLSALSITYSETSPGGSANGYEFAPDIWQQGYGADVMFWVDTNGRCNDGAFGPSTLGHFTMNGQTWTAHRYDSTSTPTGNTGNEIILVLDGPGGPGTCAQQSSGTIDIKAGLAWLSAGGFIPAHPLVDEINTGWEITQSSNATFALNRYTITATPS